MGLGMKRFAIGLRDRILRLSLRWRVGALVLLGLVVIFALFGVLGAELAQDGRQRTINQWLNLTTSTAHFIDAELQAQFDRLTSLANRLDGSIDDTPQRTAVLTDSAAQPSAFVAGTFLLDAHGALRWSDPALAAALPALLSQDAAAADPTQTVRHHASGALDFGGRVAVILDVPVLARDGHVAGVIGSVILPDKWIVNDFVSSAHGLANTGHAELVDQDLRVIVSSEPGHALGPGEHPDFYEPLLAHHWTDTGLTAPVGDVDEPIEGPRHEMAFAPLDNAHWGLALGGADTELSADADRWQTQIAIFGAVTLLIALSLVWITTRSAARR